MIRVLVVDDAPDVRMALQFMLQASGFDVIEAGDGTAALRQVTRQKVDVILSDVYMPGMDGLTLIDTISRWPVQRPALIAMSGDPHIAYRSSLDAARTLGADAALVKPFTEFDLRNTIHRLVGPALVDDPGAQSDGGRRRNRRTSEENRATALIESITTDLNETTLVLERQLRAGLDPREIGAQLQLAETLAWGRGLDIRLRVLQVRSRLHQAGFVL